ncbi:ribonucleoprotein PTB-binding 1-like isoform X1 [Bolinopsis microptera]|uniref:ribonucleoprotein PTB-binding 1-like isoform X1 n=1 Tax=Bolinopsis microptera TaxID=2820187 RepID=UPI003079DFF1
MAPMGRGFGRGGGGGTRGDQGRGISEGDKMDEHEDFSNDKPTDPADSEKLKLIEDSKTEFFKRRKIELTNLPNDPRPEEIHQLLFKDFPVSNVTVTDRNTARVTFVDSTSTKRAIDGVNGTVFKDNKISISYAPTDNFLFLGNLALSIDESMLGDMLSPFGKVSRAFLLRSLKTGYMKGCGFVEFEDREDAKNAKESLTGRFLRGRIVRTDWAPLVLNNYEELHSRTLFIDRIPKDLFDSNVLRELFAQCGKVLFCDIAINPANGESRGFGFVDFDSPDTAEKAQRMFSNYQIGNSSLRLAFGVPGRTGAHTLRQQSNSVGLNELGANKGVPPPPHPNKPHYQKPYDRAGGRGGHRPGGDTRKCFNCNETGHMARDCPRQRGGPPHGGQFPHQGPPPGQDTRTCYNCNQRGHVAKDCPRNRDQGPPGQAPPRYTAPGFQQPPGPPGQPGHGPPSMPPAPGHPPPMMPGMPPMPGMHVMPPMMPAMPPIMPAQYPPAASAVFPPGYPAAAPPAVSMPQQMAAATYHPPVMPSVSAPHVVPSPQPHPTPQPMQQPTPTPVYQSPIPAPQPAPLQPPQARPAMSVQNPGAAAVLHQTHLPIQPQQPAPSPVPDNTAQLLQLQGQIQQAASQVQLLGQQAAAAYSQAQQAPTNEQRNQYYQQYTQLYQQQQQHQQQHNTLVSQHTALLRGTSGASAATSLART